MSVPSLAWVAACLGGTAAKKRFSYEPVAKGANRLGPYFLMESALGRGVTNAPVYRWMNGLSKACAVNANARQFSRGEGACSRWSA
ncbi:hypothetical protein C4J97_2630 [Pseudomonas orientalis]|nr:hypothetical protein C4J97_2630 [Pseudomonas orientalis]